ncbi:MOSC domain-containing protein [Spirosoma rigui]|uniref:MOSC domain-containing protein n=1 Tax=Spirosoma rigui TaxID=564064 RepID=UPI0009AFE2B2|nr:MOSC N-terminal beta barrel domain-containing protein [Spirosoma rigui]
MTLSDLRLYPIKSLGGISVTEAVVDEKGFRYDRRFMLVTPSGTFITQRTNHHMALIDVAIDRPGEPEAGLRVWHRHRPDDVLSLPLTVAPEAYGETMSVTIWDSEDVPATLVSPDADAWFSRALDKPCRLVFMPDTTRRTVDPDYARHDDQGRPSVVSFADGYPYLLIGQSSLDDLNQRLAAPIEMLRFRPNIIVSGSTPYDEDAWQTFTIGAMSFYGVKPCARCVLTTIDPATGQQGREPLHTLATYRRWKHKILFGQNVLPGSAAGGILRVGDPVTVISRVTPWLSPPKLV